MQYTDSPGRATIPACEPTMTMRPYPHWTIERPTSWVTKKVPFRLTSTVSLKSSSVTSRAEFAGVIPALLIRTLIGPGRFCFSGRASDLLKIVHVQLQRNHSSAQRLDLFQQVVSSADVPEPDRDIGTRVSELEGDRATDPPAGRSDESAPPYGVVCGARGHAGTS